MKLFKRKNFSMLYHTDESMDILDKKKKKFNKVK